MKEDKPSDEEIRKFSGSPEDTPVLERSSLPSPQEQLEGGFLLEFIGKFKDKYSVFKKTRIGGIIIALVVIHNVIYFLGDVINTAKVTYDFSTDAYANAIAYLESHDTTRETADGYLVKLPPEYRNINLQDMTTEMPPATGIAPITRSMSGFQGLSGSIG